MVWVAPKDAVGGGSGGSLPNFSTTETATGQNWIDSTTPVYQKVVAIAAGPNNSTVTVAHGISGLSVLIDVRVVVGSSGTFVQLPNVSAAASVEQCTMAVDATNISLTSGVSGNYSAFSGYAILTYTKSA